MTKSMTKSQFANHIEVSIRTLQRYMKRWEREIKALDPFYKNEKVLIPKVVDFLNKKLCIQEEQVLNKTKNLDYLDETTESGLKLQNHD